MDLPPLPEPGTRHKQSMAGSTSSDLQLRVMAPYRQLELHHLWSRLFCGRMTSSVEGLGLHCWFDMADYFLEQADCFDSTRLTTSWVGLFLGPWILLSPKTWSLLYELGALIPQHDSSDEKRAHSRSLPCPLQVHACPPTVSLTISTMTTPSPAVTTSTISASFDLFMFLWVPWRSLSPPSPPFPPSSLPKVTASRTCTLPYLRRRNAQHPEFLRMQNNWSSTTLAVTPCR